MSRKKPEHLTWAEKGRQLDEIVSPNTQTTLDHLVGWTLNCPRCAGLAITERSYGWIGNLIEIAVVCRCVICGWADDARHRRDFTERELVRQAVRANGNGHVDSYRELDHRATE